MSLVVLGASISPFVRKVRIVLAEKGLDYRHVQVNPFSPPEGWRDVSPLGKIPVLRHGEHTLADSSVICAYLERRFPKPALYPADPFDYARSLWFEEYMDAGFQPLTGPRIVRPLVLAPLLTRNEPDESAEAVAREIVAKELPPLWDYLERELGERDYFVGTSLTIADVAVLSPHVSLRHAGVAPERKRWPRLRAFLDRMLGRPSVKKIVDEETPVFGKRSIQIQD
jgi:glutathione S-transferase